MSKWHADIVVIGFNMPNIHFVCNMWMVEMFKWTRDFIVATRMHDPNVYLITNGRAVRRVEERKDANKQNGFI